MWHAVPAHARHTWPAVPARARYTRLAVPACVVPYEACHFLPALATCGLLFPPVLAPRGLLLPPVFFPMWPAVPARVCPTWPAVPSRGCPTWLAVPARARPTWPAVPACAHHMQPVMPACVCHTWPAVPARARGNAVPTCTCHMQPAIPAHARLHTTHCLLFPPVLTTRGLLSPLSAQAHHTWPAVCRCQLPFAVADCRLFAAGISHRQLGLRPALRHISSLPRAACALQVQSTPSPLPYPCNLGSSGTMG